MPEIFICYRREDSEGYAGRLHDPLAARFGAAGVFLDVDTLQPGVDFDVVIKSTLGRCKVVLVIIGPGFFTSRLRDTNDFVRREIVAALSAKKRVIPVLVSGATLPSKRQVPHDIAPLLGKNAVTLNHANWKDDVGRLIRALEKILQTNRRPITARQPAKSPRASANHPASGQKRNADGKSPRKRDEAKRAKTGTRSPKSSDLGSPTAVKKPTPPRVSSGLAPTSPRKKKGIAPADVTESSPRRKKKAARSPAKGPGVKSRSGRAAPQPKEGAGVSRGSVIPVGKGTANKTAPPPRRQVKPTRQRRGAGSKPRAT